MFSNYFVVGTDSLICSHWTRFRLDRCVFVVLYCNTILFCCIHTSVRLTIVPSSLIATLLYIDDGEINSWISTTNSWSKFLRLHRLRFLFGERQRKNNLRLTICGHIDLEFRADRDLRQWYFLCRCRVGFVTALSGLW